MNLILGVVGFAGSVLKYTFWTTATVSIGVSAIAYSTKPTDDSFSRYLKEQMTDRNHGVATRIANGVVNSLVLATVKMEIHDYVVCKVAKVHEGNREQYFIGAFHHWHQIH